MLQDVVDLYTLTAYTGFVTLVSFLIAAPVVLLLKGTIKRRTTIKWHYGVAMFALIIGVVHGALGVYQSIFV
jgi:hypothetical protein